MFLAVFVRVLSLESCFHMCLLRRELWDVQSLFTLPTDFNEPVNTLEEKYIQSMCCFFCFFNVSRRVTLFFTVWHHLVIKHEMMHASRSPGWRVRMSPQSDDWEEQWRDVNERLVFSLHFLIMFSPSGAETFFYINMYPPPPTPLTLDTSCILRRSDDDWAELGWRGCFGVWVRLISDTANSNSLGFDVPLWYSGVSSNAIRKHLTWAGQALHLKQYANSLLGSHETSNSSFPPTCTGRGNQTNEVLFRCEDTRSVLSLLVSPSCLEDEALSEQRAY